MAAAFDDRREVLGGGAAAPADGGDAELGDEAGLVFGQLVGSEVVVGAPVHHRRQPGVGQAGDRHAGVAGQVAQVLGHLPRPRGAVEADDVGADGVEGHQPGADLGPDQHAAVLLDCDLHLDRHLPAGGGHGPPGAADAGLGRQQVVLGLDHEQVDAAVEQGAGLGLVGVPQGGVADVAERRHLGAGPHGTGHPALVVGRGELVGHLPGQPRRPEADLVGPVGQVVLGQHGGERPEGVGLHDVDADFEERGVEALDDVGPGEDQHLVAALEGGPTEVVGGQVLQLHPRAAPAVEHHHPVAHRLQVAGRAGRAGCRHGRSGYRAPQRGGPKPLPLDPLRVGSSLRSPSFPQGPASRILSLCGGLSPPHPPAGFRRRGVDVTLSLGRCPRASGPL